MTRRARICARLLISASVIPSAKYSCAGSPDRFCSGSTAIDLISGCVGLVARFRIKSVDHESPGRVTANPAQNLPTPGRKSRSWSEVPFRTGRATSLRLCLESPFDRLR